MAKAWKKGDVTYLKRYGGKRSVADLARHFRVTEPDVRSKLSELGIRVEAASGAAADPALPRYEEALAALHRKAWAKAAELFEKVAAATGQPELAARCRLYLEVCRRERAGGREEAADPYLEAVYLRNADRLDEALARCEHPSRRKDERFVYLAAAIRSARGELDEAAAALAKAIELNGKNRVHARHDSDFEALRRSGRFAPLFRA
jgi:tetratricopeptide (TPR) repeat protein